MVRAEAKRRPVRRRPLMERHGEMAWVLQNYLIIYNLLLKSTNGINAFRLPRAFMDLRVKLTDLSAHSCIASKSMS